MKLLYFANARIPTEKAHGIQIIKMCEAFQRQGMYVKLFAPTRVQSETMKQVDSLWEHYDVETLFEIEWIKTPDFLPWKVPPRLLTALYHVQGIFFSTRALLKTRSIEDGVYYTRSLETLLVLCATRWLHRKKIYFEAHEFHGDPSRKGGGRSLYTRLMRWMLRHSDGLIVITQRLQELYQMLGMEKQRISVAPDGIDGRRLFQSCKSGDARKKLQIPLDRNIICYTGHLFPWKGVYILAESGQYLPEYCLIYIVGGLEADQKALQQFIHSQGIRNVTLTGYIPYREVATYLSAADVLVLPNTAIADISREYTSPLKLFEYMGAGRPIVASDLPSLREIVRHGENAWLVKPDDPQSLAEGIMTVLNDQRLAGQLQVTACHEVRQFTWEQRAANIHYFLQNS